MKSWMRGAYSLLCGVFIVSPGVAAEMLLAPNIGGVPTGDAVHAIDLSGIYAGLGGHAGGDACSL